MHVTLNEWCVRTPEEVERAAAVVDQWARQRLCSCFKGFTHARLPGTLVVFNARVVYVQVQAGGALARAFASCQSALAAASFTQVGKGGAQARHAKCDYLQGHSQNEASEITAKRGVLVSCWQAHKVVRVRYDPFLLPEIYIEDVGKFLCLLTYSQMSQSCTSRFGTVA